MRTTKRFLPKLFSFTLVFLLALTAVVPAFAVPVDQENLQVVIHNNDGLPAMTDNQFAVYQLFIGTPHYEGAVPSDDEADAKEWSAENWNNWTLANVQWGTSVTDSATLLAALKGLSETDDSWAFTGEAGAKTNVFQAVNKAADLAKVLEAHKDNAFLQHFASLVVEKGNLTKVDLGDDNPDVHNGTKTEDDYLTFTLSDPGYYLFAEVDPAGVDEADATSEYILAVLGNQEIYLKASVPTIDKDIVNGDHGDKGDVAGVDDYVQFKLTGTLPKDYDDFTDYDYIFHDTLSAGLDLVIDDDHPLEVSVSNTSATDKLTDSVYTVVTDSLEDGCSVEVQFDNLKVNAPTAKYGSEIIVTYWARVNDKAVITSSGNPNTADLEFSNNPNHSGHGRTEKKTVYVYAFGLDLTKVASDKLGDADTSNDGLAGAGFVMKDKNDHYAIFKDQYVNKAGDSFSDTADATHTQKIRRLIGWTDTAGDAAVKDLIEKYNTAKKDFDKASTAEQTAPDGAAYKELQAKKDALAQYLLESEGAKGEIPDIYGLDEGQYALHEVITPDGYNPMAEDFDIKIEAEISSEKLKKVTYTHDGETVTYLDTKAAYNEANALPDGETMPDADEIGNRVTRFKSGLLADTIVNQKAPFLPFTGGVGTLVFYILGAALIAGAVTYLVIVAKKRRRTEENA